MFALPEPSAEFRLASALCRWPRTPAVLEAIRRAAAAVTDWPNCLKVVKRQRIWGLAYEGLQAADVVAPSFVMQALAHQARRIATQNLSMVAEAARLQAAFNAAEIDVIFLKGIVLAQQAYGTLSLKHGKDIDLWIIPSQIEMAWQCLERLGYRQDRLPQGYSPAMRQRYIRYKKEIGFLSSHTSGEVELHWRLSDTVNLFETPWRENTSRICIGGFSLRALVKADLFCYLAQHGAMHAWYRLKWLADFNAVLAEKSLQDIDALYRQAVMRGAGLQAAYALLLCREYLALPVDAALLAELQQLWRVRTLCRLTDYLMCGDRLVDEPVASQSARFAVICAWFIQCRSIRVFLRQGRVFWFSDADMCDCPLPPRLFFLYPVLRLPLWVVRRVMQIAKRPHPVDEGAKMQIIKGL
ncbi:MAG: nucleotidyltransferase family protein [Rhizomicrobium sp.]